MILILIGAIVTAFGNVLHGIDALVTGGTWDFLALSIPAGTMALISFAFAAFGLWQGYRNWQRAL
ncbi:MAG: hypothetical protein FWD06_03440 [Oscillospiraceae bacterium]|nr:hypothetical protein [Oscillospiraceae bacterium]